MKRLLIASLTIALCISLGVNALLISRLPTLVRHNEMLEAQLAAKGRASGTADAQRDFQARTPKWYVAGEIPGPIPSDKPGRTLDTVGCIVGPYELAYVEWYNKTMDDLMQSETDSAASLQ